MGGGLVPGRRTPRAEVPKHELDVSAAVAPAPGGLIGGKALLQNRAHRARDRGPEEPPEARGKLEGPAHVGCAWVGLLGNPHEEVHVRAKYHVERSRTDMRAVPCRKRHHRPRHPLGDWEGGWGMKASPAGVRAPAEAQLCRAEAVGLTCGRG